MAYDYLIVGGGIAGLTMARLMGKLGGRVLLIEKDRELGGSVKRFHLQGIPFDTGFHFTGGLTANGDGLLDQILNALEIHDRIVPIRATSTPMHRMVLPFDKSVYLAPLDSRQLQAKLVEDFPAIRDGLRRYFARYDSVIANTPTLRLDGFDEMPPPIKEDFVTLQAVFDESVPDPLAQLVLGSLALCHGTAPNQISFAAHARVCFGLHQSLSRVQGGGQAFVDALEHGCRQCGVEIRTGVSLEGFGEVEDRRARSFKLSDGSSIDADACVLSLHPQQVVGLCQDGTVSKAFRERVASFEPSIGFSALFGTMDSPPPDREAFLTTTYPQNDLNQMMTCRSDEAVDGPMVVLRSPERLGRRNVDAVTALEVAFPQWTRRWQHSRLGDRPPDYAAFKQRRIESMLSRLDPCLPGCQGLFKLCEGASMLTYRDYLHSPEGSAYGIRQKIGQFNVIGRLPVTNCHVIGQSALLPGLLGAMTSAFLVSRKLLGSDRFHSLISST